MSEESIPKGNISDVGILNLLSAKTEEDLRGIAHISDVGMILIPEHLSHVLAQVDMSDVGTVLPVPTDAKVSLMTGQVTMSGESFASGDPQSVLVVAGQVLVTSVIKSVGFREVRLMGQVLAPKGSETALMAASAQIAGQVVYYPEGARVFVGTESISQAFLEYLPGPTPLVFVGTGKFEKDVDLDTLRAKVPEILAIGTVTAPRRLLPLVQVLARERFGSVEASED